MKNRATRRHHMKRMKAKAKKIVSKLFTETEFEIKDRRVGAFAHTRTRCSCFMCGNPRKHFKEKTLQEKKHSSLG